LSNLLGVGFALHIADYACLELAVLLAVGVGYAHLTGFGFRQPRRALHIPGSEAERVPPRAP
jgi:hypothetical protein